MTRKKNMAINRERRTKRLSFIFGGEFYERKCIPEKSNKRN